jgi:PPE-repeat protein
LLILLAAGTSAEVYRWVDAEGQTHFSDRPVPGSERVDPRSGTASVGPEPTVPEASLAPMLGPYSGFEIVSPEANQTLRLESGSLPVSLLLDPPLMVGHRLELLVDGVPISIEEPIGTQLTLNGLSFGTHMAVARVLDSIGVVARSAPVSFHLRRPLPPGVLP